MGGLAAFGVGASGGRADRRHGHWYRIGVIYPLAFPLPSFLEWAVEHWLPCGQSRRSSLFGRDGMSFGTVERPGWSNEGC